MFFTNPKYQEIWINLRTNSKRALTRNRAKLRHLKRYKPRSDLVLNLSQDLNRPPLDIYNDLIAMQQELKK